VTGRLRGLAERPVSPGVARAILTTALAVTVGIGCVVALGLGARHEPPIDHLRAGIAWVPSVAPARSRVEPRTPPEAAHRRQDPQDRPGTAAHGRADQELATHRALQHVPWHRGGVSIRLVGARGRKAVLSVSGPSRAADRHGRRSFLRRFDDDGRSYLFRLEVAKGGRP